MHVLSLGITAAICHGITGSKWREIHPQAELVTSPGGLVENVREHLMIVTDETGTCRRSSDDGSCLEDDFVFHVDEQRNPILLKDPRVTEVVMAAGHGAVVGTENRPPHDLVRLLQEHEVMAPTPPERIADLRERGVI